MLALVSLAIRPQNRGCHSLVPHRASGALLFRPVLSFQVSYKWTYISYNLLKLALFFQHRIPLRFIQLHVSVVPFLLLKQYSPVWMYQVVSPFSAEGQLGFSTLGL